MFPPPSPRLVVDVIRFADFSLIVRSARAIALLSSPPYVNTAPTKSAREFRALGQREFALLTRGHSRRGGRVHRPRRILRSLGNNARRVFAANAVLTFARYLIPASPRAPHPPSLSRCWRRNLGSKIPDYASRTDVALVYGIVDNVLAAIDPRRVRASVSGPDGNGIINEVGTARKEEREEEEAAAAANSFHLSHLFISLPPLLEFLPGVPLCPAAR